MLLHTVNAQNDTVFWPSGEIRSVASYKDGQRNGSWTMYYINGKIESEGEYGLKGKTGAWKRYYATGELSIISLYKNGDLNNYTYKSFYRGGQPKLIGTIQNGHTLHNEEYYKHGVLKSTTENNKDSADIRKQFYENGALKEVRNFSSKLKNGTNKTYYISGELKRIEEFTDRKMTGVWKEFYQNGQIKQTEECVPSIAARDLKEYYLNGQLKRTGRYDYSHSTRSTHKVEDWKEFHENGQLQKEYQYKDGLEFGVWKEFYDDGALFKIGEYSAGKPIGYWETFYQIGQLKQTGMYLENVYRMEKKGEWKDYHENGQLKRTCKHGYRGRGGEQKEYYKNGKLKLIGQWDGEVDIRFGEWRYYRKNGRLKRIEVYDYDGIILPISTYHINEKIITTNQNYEGPYDESRSKDDLSKCLKYKRGKSKYYYKSGMPQFVKKYKGGNQQNIYIRYYRSGGVATKEEIKNGENIGYRKVYFENEKGVSNHINPKLKAEGKTKNSFRVGEWKIYHENGKLHQVKIYDSGKLMEIKSCFDKEENELPIGTLKNGNGTVLVYNKNGELIGLLEYENGIQQRD